MKRPVLDAFVLGAGVAGAIAALALARRGLTVGIADKKAQDADYKLLCTHCIQPIALPVLRKLGLFDDLLKLGAVPTKMAVHTRAGVIDPPGLFYDEAGTLTALNTERRLLDPFLTARLRATPGVEVHIGAALAGAERDADGTWTIALAGEGAPRMVRCRLLVAADGRGSQLARLLGNQEVLRGENDRACSFAYFRGVTPPADDRTLYFVGAHDEATFYYPLGGDRALLAAFVPKALHRERGTRAEKVRTLLDRYAGCSPHVDLARAEPSSEVYGYLNYPNVLRAGAAAGVPFIGDAAMSLDPMSGSGCAFGIVAADMMVDEIGDALAAGGDLHAAVERYAARYREYFFPRAQGVAADSRVGKSTASIDAVHRRICEVPALQRAFVALIGRVTTPTEFQRAFLTLAVQRRASTVPSA